MFQKELCALVFLNTDPTVLNQLHCTWKVSVNPRGLGIIWRERTPPPPPPPHLDFVRKWDYVLIRELVWFQHPRMCSCQFFILPGGKNRHQPGPALHGPTAIIFLNNSSLQHSPAYAAVIALPASVLFPGTPLGSQVSATLWGCCTSTGSANWQTLLRNSGHLPALQWYHMLVGISPSQRCLWWLLQGDEIKLWLVSLAACSPARREALPTQAEWREVWKLCDCIKTSQKWSPSIFERTTWTLNIQNTLPPQFWLNGDKEQQINFFLVFS